jgi:hypothetical protein
MDPVTDHLDSSAPPSLSARPGVAAELAAVTTRITRHRRVPRRGIVAAGVIALVLGGSTAAAAATGLFSDMVDDNLGQHADADFVIEIEVRGVTYTCWGGVAVMPFYNRPGSTYSEEDYLAAKHYIQDHDWSDLKPDPSLLGNRPATAEQLAITAARSMIEIMQQDGLGVESITTRGTANCES